jgi:hypothetical protein
MQTLSQASLPSIVSDEAPILSDEVQMSAISWAAIAAGAVASAALTLLFIAFGAGIGLSAVSTWSDSGVSITTFKIGTGIYLVCAAIMASSVGGYLAGRLRTKWVGVHSHEVYFRDTAHGFLAWAFATLLSASVLSAAATHIVGGASQVLGQTAGQSRGGPADLFVDKVLRPAPGVAPAPAPPAFIQNNNDQAVRGEISRLFTASVRDGRDLSPADRTYVAQVVVVRTGLSQVVAEKRVSDAIVEAREAADAARKAAAQLALWLTAAMLVGAFAASLAATEGGQLRDGTWSYDRAPVRKT